MNLYLLNQNDNTGYDTYSDCVVAAEDPSSAQQIHPAGAYGCGWDPTYYNRSWARCPENVKVELIGLAVEGTKAGIICSSYHAG